MHDAMKAKNRTEWQELGFHYTCDNRVGEWVIVGSRAGLAHFAALLREYVADPANAILSEHEHYGPYQYLEIMTWTEAGIDDHSIHGTLQDLQRLADLVDARTAVLKVGERARIREDYSATFKYSLILDLREDSFDPASLDANPWLSG